LLAVSLEVLYLRPTVGQLPCKFFENTRDGGNGEHEMVSTRLPKNFQRNHPTLSASKLISVMENNFVLLENCGINKLTH
jgi:hypothetical protein